MEQQDAYNALLQTIQYDLKHQDYKRVCELANDYNIFITADNIKEKLIRFNPRENEAMFEQRVRITKAITPAIASSLQNPFNKVPRTPPVSKKIIPLNKNDNNSVTEIQDRIDSFYGGDSLVGGLDYWFQNRFVDLSFIDPNSWVVIEFDPFDANIEKPNPRPFEVPADKAINFLIVNNQVQWLIIETDILYPVKQQSSATFIAPANQMLPSNFLPSSIQNTSNKTGKKYTLYADNIAVTFTQTSDDDNVRILQTPGAQLVNIPNKGAFVVEYYNTLTQGCPAFRVGYISDVNTSGRTFVNPFHDAICYFEKSIKTVSEFDLSTCLHAFPQKIIRVTKSCEGFNGMKCDRGKLPDGKECPTCKGTGKPIHASAQDVVEVVVPENSPDSDDKTIPLSDYVYYVDLPVETLEFQQSLIDAYEVKCHQTVFNSTSLLRKNNGGQQIDPTATEVDNDMDNVYDTLAPFGEKISSVWTFIVQKIAVLTDNDTKVKIIHRFPSNFRLKSRADLYAERNSLTTANAPSFVVEAVDDELAEDIFADNTEGLLHYRVKQQHYPFPGKSFTEIQFLLTLSTTLQTTKVLYTYFDQIFIELERQYKIEGKDFYLDTPQNRQTAIAGKVQQLIEQLNAQNQVAFSLASAFQNPKQQSSETDNEIDDDGEQDE